MKGRKWVRKCSAGGESWKEGGWANLINQVGYPIGPCSRIPATPTTGCVLILKALMVLLGIVLSLVCCDGWSIFEESMFCETIGRKI